MSMVLIVVTVSWVFVYVQISQTIHFSLKSRNSGLESSAPPSMTSLFFQN